jgi:hypothetical protein
VTHPVRVLVVPPNTTLRNELLALKRRLTAAHPKPVHEGGDVQRPKAQTT